MIRPLTLRVGLFLIGNPVEPYLFYKVGQWIIGHLYSATLSNTFFNNCISCYSLAKAFFFV